MNAIQIYLKNMAIATIRKASAGIIQDGDVNPEMVVASMQELIAHLDTLNSTVKCDLKYAGVFKEKTIYPNPRDKQKEGDAGVYPYFFIDKANKTSIENSC